MSRISAMAYSHAYLEGIQLFNTGAFWHAHEQWEACWLAATEPDATFYKGMIQAAATLVKWQRGNLRGVELNWAKSRPKLLRLPTPYMGVDLAAFVGEMEHFVRVQASEPSPAPPQIHLLASNLVEQAVDR